MDTECNSNIVCHIGTNSIALQLQAILFKLVTASFSQSIGQFFLTVVFFEHNTVSIKFDILCTLQLKKNQSQNSLPIRIRKLACSFVNINQRKKEIHSSSNLSERIFYIVIKIDDANIDFLLSTLPNENRNSVWILILSFLLHPKNAL